MSGPPGMAIDPTLLWQQQARLAAAAAASGSSVKEEEQGDGDNNNSNDNNDSEGASMNEDKPAASATGSSLPSATNAANVHAPNGQASSSSPKEDSKPGTDDVMQPMPAIDLRDDAELAAFLAKMEDYEPILPDSVTRFYLEKAGFQSADDRV